MPINQSLPPVSFLTLRDYLTNLVNLNGGVYWPLDDAVNNPYNRAINKAVAKGRNVVMTPDFSVDADWGKGAGVTISGGAGHLASVAISSNALTQSIPATVGKVYEVTYTILNYSSGSVQLRWSGGSAATRSANGTYTENLICVNTGLVLFTVTASTMDIDDISVKELNITAQSDTLTNLIADGNAEGNINAWTVGNSANGTHQPGTPHGGTNVLRIARNGVNSPYLAQMVLTIGQPYRISGVVRSDGTSTPTILNGATGLAFGSGTGTFWKRFDFVFIATATDIRLGSNAGSGTSFVEFDDVFVSLDNGLRSGTLGEDLDAEGDINVWIIANSALVTHQTGTPHGGTNCLRIQRNGATGASATQPCFCLGHTYLIEGYYRSDGTGIATVQETATVLFTGTTTTNFTKFSVVRVAATTALRLTINNSSGNNYVEFDDITITEISPLVAIPNNGLILGNADVSRILAYTNADGINDYLQPFSNQLNSIWPADEMSVIFFVDVTDTSLWTNGTLQIWLGLQNSNSTSQILFQKITTSNTVSITYRSNNVQKTTSFIVGSPSTWLCFGISISKSGDFVKAYYNGVLQGTLNTISAWTRNLTVGNCAGFAGTSTPTNPIKSYGAHLVIINSPLSDSEFETMAKLGDTSS